MHRNPGMNQRIKWTDTNSNRLILQESHHFVNFAPTKESPFEDNSAAYCSLVTLVKEKYPFDDVLIDKAVQFLNILEPQWCEVHLATRLITELVPSSAGPPSDFIESILTLLSSPHSTIVEATSVLLTKIVLYCSSPVRLQLVESDLISKVLASVQPHTLPFSGNETVLNTQLRIIMYCINLALPVSLKELGITTADSTLNHREMILRKVIIPSSRFMTFLISNQHILNGDLSSIIMTLFVHLIQMGPFHLPTLEFVLASPIAMAFSKCLSFVEDSIPLLNTLRTIERSLNEWKNQGPEVLRSGKRMNQTLHSEGFEDLAEQMMMTDVSENFGDVIVKTCRSIFRIKGSNVTRR
ncbi:hypothetical protein BLNAU_1320 [Blattamonas nauphoetae]|uniref:Uncharacterized protein n=1 Tax=Blattamonas nauphoetae TaxID=2049346 RepID=A0ABQ9YJ26_9EUKA|nr:hypothetical protein BLNAU_1320 [Blattamonas nauphoetae]